MNGDKKPNSAKRLPHRVMLSLWRVKIPLAVVALLTWVLASSWSALNGWPFAALFLGTVYNALLLLDALTEVWKKDI